MLRRRQKGRVSVSEQRIKIKHEGEWMELIPAALLKDLIEQNKRYHEAIEKAETELMDKSHPLDFHVGRAIDILVEALEESE